ncbi:MAG: sigma-54-dependent Fis family transcriptional regulator [Pirellulaceae bacterium]|jgi:two-component system response regulator HydG|nr:sigma-54-dependent Fis family transcriptional regulator [Pirellulaceae bacterium]
MAAGSILIVDDQQSMCEMLETDLRLRGHRTQWCQSATAALDIVREQNIDVVLTDVRMPGTSGLQLCDELQRTRPDIAVVVMTAFGSLETAVAAMRAGAYDFITKPVELDLLALTIDRAVERQQLGRQVKLLTEQQNLPRPFGELIGDSPAMHRIYDQLPRLAASDASLLITGESGTGKELVARSIHDHSPRSGHPFVAINCAAMSETLLESELFGHTRGAFTDARQDRKGLFLEAEGGTLLLDEIGDMPVAMQVKLLRALEENRLRPVGSDREIPFNVRLLAATHRDLETAVEEERFRADLFYRINVIQLHLPPLRARGTDVLMLTKHFVERFAAKAQRPIEGVDEAVAERLLAYSWPGNIRELRNVIERAVTLTRHNVLTVEDLPEKVRDHRSSTVYIGGDDPTELVPMEEIERRYIAHVLKAVDNNQSQAAKILGVDRKTLYRKLKNPDS